jgi:hypothetical protein
MNGVWNHLLKGCDVLNSSTGQENLGKLLLSLHDIERKECERRGGTLIRLLVSNLSSSSVTVKIFALRKFVLLWNHSITLNWSCHVRKEKFIPVKKNIHAKIVAGNNFLRSHTSSFRMSRFF